MGKMDQSLLPSFTKENAINIQNYNLGIAMHKNDSSRKLDWKHEKNYFFLCNN